jgi:hypothetical protein
MKPSTLLISLLLSTASSRPLTNNDALSSRSIDSNPSNTLTKRNIEIDIDDPPSYHNLRGDDPKPAKPNPDSSVTNDINPIHAHPFGTPHPPNEHSPSSPFNPNPNTHSFADDLSDGTLRILTSRLSHSRIWGSEDNLNNLLPIPKKGRWGYELEFDGYGLMTAFQRWVGYDEWRGCGWRRECMVVDRGVGEGDGRRDEGKRWGE